MSETIEGLMNKFFELKDVFESEGLTDNLGKTKLMVSFTEDCLSKSKFNPCEVCNLGVKANSVLCVECAS